MFVNGCEINIEIQLLTTRYKSNRSACVAILKSFIGGGQRLNLMSGYSHEQFLLSAY